MKQKPFNDNLVMASIESLYEQASHIDRPSKAVLQRHNPNDLPIIGSLPVQIGHEQKRGHLDDIVLTGRLQAALSDEKNTAITARESSTERKEDNPFLAIRQAVIAAGDKKNQIAGQLTPSEQTKAAKETIEKVTPEAELVDKIPTELAEQTFANQLARLIDSEIERRLAERTSYTQETRRKRPPSARTRKKQKTAQKSKHKETVQPAIKKPSTTKRKRPK